MINDFQAMNIKGNLWAVLANNASVGASFGDIFCSKVKGSQPEIRVNEARG